MLAAIGVGSCRSCSTARSPPPCGSGARWICPRGCRAGGLRAPARARRAQRQRRRGAQLPRRRHVRPLCAGADRHADGALGVPDPLHALPAGDLPGRAAGDVRVPDRDLRAHGAARRPTPRCTRGPRRVAAAGYLAKLHNGRRRFVVSRGPAPALARRRCAPTRTATGPRSSRSALRDGVTDPDAWAAAIDGDTGAVFFAQPNFYGAVEDARALSAAAKGAGRRDGAERRRCAVW